MANEQNADRSLTLIITLAPGALFWGIYKISLLLKWHSYLFVEHISGIKSIVISYDMASLSFLIAVLMAYMNIGETRKSNNHKLKYYNSYISCVTYGVVHVFLSLVACATIFLGNTSQCVVEFIIIEFINAICVNFAMIIIVLNLMRTDK